MVECVIKPSKKEPEQPSSDGQPFASQKVFELVQTGNTHQSSKLHLDPAALHPLKPDNGTGGIGQQAVGTVNDACNFSFLSF